MAINPEIKNVCTCTCRAGELQFKDRSFRTAVLGRSFYLTAPPSELDNHGPKQDNQSCECRLRLDIKL